MNSGDKLQGDKGKKYTESQLLALKEQAKDGQRKLREIIEREEPQSPDSKAAREHSS